ncbi:hypothetical protein [Streptococcus ovis]|uniref:hypothetical protein n=1 Tax=Streptococcus ovis TaxID=82806 RepID=UPI00037FFCCA|nr:hypothetical protein [Streptococcus ovis]
MPRSLKESLIFTTLMCSMMVFAMSCWNLFVVGHFAWPHVFLGFLPGFLVAFLLDWYIVGPIAKKAAAHYIIQPTARKNQGHVPKIVPILAISGCMVLGMVTCMSLYGLVMSQGLAGLNLTAYFKAWGTNFIMAVPLNLLLVGNISRFLLGKIQVWIDRTSAVKL